jgi:thiol:disulfide interchange protein DsbD
MSRYIYPQEESPVCISIAASPEQPKPGQRFQIALEFKIKQGYYIYGPIPISIKVEAPEGVHLDTPVLPQPIRRYFEALGRELNLYEGTVHVRIPGYILSGTEPAGRKLSLYVSYQVCTETACLSKERLKYALRLDSEGRWIIPAGIPEDLPSKDILPKGMIWLLGMAFAAGLGSSLTPCIYPMIPVTVSFFALQASTRQTFSIALVLAYILGISITFTGLGYIVGKMGRQLGFVLQEPVAILTIVCIFVMLGLAMFGLYELKAPAFITQRISRAKRGIFGAISMGLVVGVVAAPCVGPILTAILGLILKRQDPFLGAGALFLYALGFSMPLAVLALFSVNLPKIGTLSVVIKDLFGILIFGAALWFLSMIVPLAVVSICSGILLFALFCYVFVQVRRPNISGIRKVALGILCGVSLLLGLFFTVGLLIPSGDTTISEGAIAFLLGRSKGQIDWIHDEGKGLEKARAEGKPVLIDFYASWCIPCTKMERDISAAPDVMRELERFVTIKIDVSEDQGEWLLTEKYGFKGVPALAFYDSQGNYLKGLALSGYNFTMRELLQILRKIR